MKEVRREASICIHQDRHQDIGNNYNLESKKKFYKQKKILISFFSEKDFSLKVFVQSSYKKKGFIHIKKFNLT